jgi:cytoskeleton protein RodZ
MSVSDAAAKLRLFPRQVEALEANAYDRLPGAAFVRGFARNYAKLLQLDEREILDALDAGGVRTSARIFVPNQNIAFSPGARQASRRLWIGALLLLLIAGAGAAVLRWEAGLKETGRKLASRVVQDRPQTSTASLPVNPPSTTQPESVPAAAKPVEAEEPKRETVTDAAVPAPTAAASQPEPQRSRLRFSFGMDSWVEIRDANGGKVWSQLSQKGTQQEVVADPPLRLVIGNAAYVKLSHNDRDVDLGPYMKGSVARLTLEK